MKFHFESKNAASCEEYCVYFYYLDAKSNEKVIGNLKNAIEVQEETMEKQDMVLQEREEELKQLQNGRKKTLWISKLR